MSRRFPPTAVVRDDGTVHRIVLLRGINVGGNRKVAMADLQDGLVEAGFDRARSYIQSGNLVVEGGPDDDAAAAHLVTGVLAQRFGFDDVPVIVMRRDRLLHAAATSATLFPPPDDDAATIAAHAKHTHVVFLLSSPSPTRRASLAPSDFAPDRFALDVHDGVAELHVEYASGAGTSKLTGDRIERAFGVRATARNLNTVARLLALSEH